ncbi:uncharacterized protein LOC114543683 [Dendronephthya gigantea]|uniref:uncharacterized protein LOC114543683 n=1 Tax=Dendronephthya gigantea TaxID=151771 RepID=UPI00106D2BC8|nr:uncharacterized protein LOC114543683 [Dendronephthya gigantea]
MNGNCLVKSIVYKAEVSSDNGEVGQALYWYNIRKVAKSQNVSWCEHWKFLDGFTDLSTSDGLVKLEEYLKTKAHRLNLEKTVPVETRVPIESSSFCSPCGSISDDVFERSDGTPLSCISSRNKNSNLKNFRGRLKLEESLEDRGTEPIIKHDASQKTCEKICSIKQSLSSSDTNELSPDYDKRSSDISNCSEISLSELTSEIRILSVGDDPNPRAETNFLNLVSDCPTIKDQNNYDTKDTPRKTNSDKASLFIEGNQPSKVDLDVFRIIKTTTVDPASYPYISCWLKNVRSFSKTNRLAWPSPGSPRYHETRRSMLKTWSC